jgi:hypothetical protein
MDTRKTVYKKSKHVKKKRKKKPTHNTSLFQNSKTPKSTVALPPAVVFGRWLAGRLAWPWIPGARHLYHRSWLRFGAVLEVLGRMDAGFWARSRRR